MELIYYICIWFYLFGLIGIFLTQAAVDGYPAPSLAFRNLDTVSLVSMIFWPVTVPLFCVLHVYDFIREVVHNWP